MTLGAVSGSDSSSAVSFCSCCGAKMVPYFSDDAVVSKNQINQLISESFLTVKGAALFLPRGNSPTPNTAPRMSQRRNKHTGDLQKHLQTMFTVLRPEDTIRLAVRLESAYPQLTRYMVVVSTNGRQDTEESIVLGMDFFSSDSCCSVGLVLPLWSDTRIHLDGDGGFSVSTVNRVHVFKPVSVQAMWSSLQSLHKACEVARCHNYYPGSLFLTWISYYQSRISSNQFCINEWNAMQDVESHRANSPVLFTDLPTERERTERLIKTRLREIMMQKDLENVTCKEIRTELEMQMVCNLREFKEFIDNEMIAILGQMDSPTEIFEHVYLGSEWNASNLEELQNSGVRYILNVTREIDNFFPGEFEYHNIRVYDEEATNLLEYWNETYKFIAKAKKAGAKCLVHCKMGVSRSASTVIAYAMKEYGWTLDAAYDYVKERRAVTKPNPSFMKQLEEYQGILLASKQRHNKLWRSHSDSDLSDRPDPMCKPLSHSLGRSDSHGNNNSSPSLQHFLGVAVLQALRAEREGSADSSCDSPTRSEGACDSPVQEEVGSDGDVPLLPLTPRPRAATVVPEERVDNAASVAITVPVPAPHPPPSLHILPPTPKLQRARSGPLTPLSGPAHRTLELLLNGCEECGSEEISPVTTGSSDSDALEQSSSDLMSDKPSPLSPVGSTPSSPLSTPCLNDDNNNPSDPFDSRREPDGLSSHSSDSIDFFSAREKFLGRAQDSGARVLAEEAPRGTGSLDQDEPQEKQAEEEESGNGTSQSSPLEDTDDRAGPEQTHHHDNSISVRHIVTEIEAICHPTPCLAAMPSSSSSLPPSSQSLQVARPEQLEEAEEGAAQDSPPSQPQSPAMLPSDWPAGSVRRATEQLEQKLRQEMETVASQRSPLHSPNAEHPTVRVSLSPPSSEHPPLHSTQGSADETLSQGENIAVSTETKDRSERLGMCTEFQRLNHSGSDTLPRPPRPTNLIIRQVSGATPVTVITSGGSHVLAEEQISGQASNCQVVEASPDTSANYQRGVHTRREVCSHPVGLEGATVQESDTDETLEPGACGRFGGCGPGCEARSRLAHGGHELEKIQQTLRELQAFLHEGVGLETAQEQEPAQHQGLRDPMDTEPGLCKGGGAEGTPGGPDVGPRRCKRQDGNGFPEPTGWHRAMELEARIRQAGLTPPSLMKRSASLAKLDSLELSANDLSDLDLRPHARTTPPNPHGGSSAPPSHPDDSWKKQKVLAQSAAPEKTPLSHATSSSYPHRCVAQEMGEREEPEGGGGGANVTAPPSRQQGRPHASRRSRKASAEKKQRAATAAALYNTM